MPKMLNPETGEEVEVSNAEAMEAYSQGTLIFNAKEEYRLLSEDGYPTTYKGNYLDSAFARGDSFEPEVNIDEQNRKVVDEGTAESYNNAVDKVQAGVEGFGRGVTLGGSDILFSAVDKEGVQARKKHLPGISTGAEIGGLVLSTLATGGTSLGAKAGMAGVKAGFAAAKSAKGLSRAAKTAKAILNVTPAAQVSKIGRSISTLGKGKGLAGRALASAGAGVVETGLYGTGQGISELALSNEPLSLERAVSVVGSNSLSGALYGGVIGGALPVVGAVGKVVGGTAKKAYTKVPEAIKKFLPGSRKETEKLLMTQREVLVKELTAVQNYAKVSRGSVVDELAVLNSGDKIKDVTRINNLNRVLKEFDEVNVVYNELFTTAKEVGTGSKTYTFKVTDVASNILKQSDDELKRSLSVINDFGQTTKQMVDAATDVGNAGANAISAQLGLKPKVQGIQSTVSSLTTAKEAAKISGSVGFGEYTVLAGAIGIDPEAIPGLSWIPGPLVRAIVIGRFANKYIGGHLDKRMFARVAKGASAADAATAVVASKAAIGADKIDNGIRNFLKGPATTATIKTKVPTALAILNNTSYDTSIKKSKGKDIQAAYKARLEELDTLSAAPDVVRQKVTDSIGPVPENIAKGIQQIQIRKINFLAKKIPRDPSGERLIPKEFKPPSFELKKFARYMRAAEDPSTVLEDMKNGTLTQEGVEALRVIYPEIYADMQIKIFESIPELQLKLNYKSRLQLSRLYQVAVDPSMEPLFISAMQDDFQATNDKASKPGKSFSVPAMDGPVSDTLVSKKVGEF